MFVVPRWGTCGGLRRDDHQRLVGAVFTARAKPRGAGSAATGLTPAAIQSRRGRLPPSP